MRLKVSDKEHFLQSKAKEIWQRRKEITTKKRALFLLLGFYSLLLFSAGIVVHRNGWVGGQIKPFLVAGFYKIPKNYLKSFMVTPKRIIIDIKSIDYQKLEYQREIALARGFLIHSSEDFVPAQIRYQDKSLKVKLRLKGDRIDHLGKDKWSFRVQLEGENSLFGMKRFSLQHPGTRKFLYEWVMHQALAREGLPSLRYDFVNVVVNGKDWGIFALEEHFEKRLIESNQLREGPIIKFDESLLWQEKEIINARVSGYGDYTSAPIVSFQSNKVQNDPILKGQFEIGANLLDGFRREEYTTTQVFDTEKFARYLALTDLFGAHHALFTRQFRFYYNPITALLEPAPYDFDAGEKLPQLASTYPTDSDPKDLSLGDNAQFLGHLFKDLSFYEIYIKELNRFSEPSYLNQLFVNLEKDLDHNLKILYREFPWYSLDRSILYANQDTIRHLLKPVQGIHAYFNRETSTGIHVRVGNIQKMPIEVLQLVDKDGKPMKPKKRLILPPKYSADPVDFQEIGFLFPDDLKVEEGMQAGLKVLYRVLGVEEISEQPFLPWPYAEGFEIENLARATTPLPKRPFLKADTSQKKIWIPKGKWRIDEDLIIPKNYELILGEGTNLDFVQGAAIISFSPLRWQATAENPIRIGSSDQTGKGIAVLKAKELSILDYVIFNGLTNPSRGGWALTGAVTFYESPVQISNSQFLNNRSEDALNIVRSSFVVQKSLFENTFADALDTDFSKGEMVGVSFVNLGNDAVDLSGSVVHLEDIFIRGAKDKGLSVGENSRAEVKNIDIVESALALAGKDMSHLEIQGLHIAHCQYGVAAYQKKTEFPEPANIVIQNITLEDVQQLYLVEVGSNVVVEGRKIEPNQKLVKELLYGNQ